MNGMAVQVELWALLTFLVGLFISFIGCVFGFAKVLGGQIDKRLDEKFKAQDAAREAGSKALRDTLQQHLEQEKRTAEQITALEREFLTWKGELPLHYVRREDYVRGQTVLEAKLDAVFSELKLVQIKGAKNG